MRFQMTRNRDNSELSNEQLQKLAPSAFAGQPHDSRSNRYTFIPTIDVIDGMRAAGFVPVSATQSLSRVPGKQYFTKHQVRFCSLTERNRADMQLGDVSIEAVMTNSHDGTSQYELLLGAFRKACMNGMFVSAGMVESIKVRHTGNIIHSVIDSAERIIEMAPKVACAIRLWQSIQLNQDEQMILAEGALALRFDESAPIPAVELLRVNRNADVRDDLWTVFNRVQENTTRGRIPYTTRNQHGEPRRARTYAVRGIGENTRLNRELWALAEKMAALKA